MGANASQDEKNLFGYLAREFETLDERPLAEVDSLVLACLSYYRWPGEEVRGRDGVPVRELFRAECFDEMTRGLWDPEGLVRLLTAVAASPRFRDVRVCCYVDDFDETAEKQFSACTLRLPSGGAYPSLAGQPNLNVRVSISEQLVYIRSGERVLYTMIASTGVNGTTPLGTYYVSGRGYSFYNAGEGMGGRYWVNFLRSLYLFHTVPVDAAGNYIESEAMKLGRPASHGCVRLTIPDARFLYENLPDGTRVTIS